MHEKFEHLLAPKTQRQEDVRQNKLPFPLLSFLLQILLNVKFSIWIFTSKIVNIFNAYLSFLAHFL